MAGGSPAATAELCVAGSPDGSPGRESPSPPPFPADADDVEDDRFARPCDFAIRLVKLHNVPLTPGEQVEVAWEGFHQSGVTSAIVHADGTAPLRHRFHIHHRPHAEGPTAGRPSVHELHFCVRQVRPNYSTAANLDKLTLTLLTSDPLSGRMGIASSKNIVLILHLEVTYPGQALPFLAAPTHPRRHSGARRHSAGEAAEAARPEGSPVHSHRAGGIRSATPDPPPTHGRVTPRRPGQSDLMAASLPSRRSASLPPSPPRPAGPPEGWKDAATSPRFPHCTAPPLYRSQPIIGYHGGEAGSPRRECCAIA